MLKAPLSSLKDASRARVLHEIPLLGVSYFLVISRAVEGLSPQRCGLSVALGL